MLARWAAFAPNRRMRDSLEGLSVEQVMGLQEADYELYLLLSGQAPAELELAAVNGRLSDTAPTAQQQQQAAVRERVNELLSLNPWAPGSVNLTAQMELSAIAPDVYEAQVKQHTPAQPAHQFTEGDQRVLAAHGYAIPTA